MVKVYSYEDIAEHNSEQDLWLIINNKVYDCTKFLEEHPGGDEILLDLGGQDATEAFTDIGHSDDAVKMLDDLYIGEVDTSSEPVVKEATQGNNTTGSEGNGMLWLAFIVIFLAVAYYNYHHSKWF